MQPPKEPPKRTALFAAIVVVVIAALIGAMMYIDSLGEAEGPSPTHLKDAADR